MPHTHVHRNRWIAVPFAAALLTVPSACGGSAPADGAAPLPTASPTTAPMTSVPDTTEGSNLGGFGAPAAAPDEFGPLPGVELVGTAELADDGCWYLRGDGDAALLVAPTGTQLGDDGVTLVTADGLVIEHGAPIDVRGGLVPFTDLPGGLDGKWGNYTTFCSPTYEALVVADQITPEYDPVRADPVALATELDSSVFDTDYGCGYGFTTGDAEGRWALRIDVLTDPPPAAGPVELPDERFQVSVTAGAHLFANHCDDVMEWFEPMPSPAVVWPVTSGQFTYPGTSGELCGGAPATITLVGATVDTAAGPVVLDPIEIANDSFGCFAG